MSLSKRHFSDDEEVLRQHGQRLTPQRRMVLEIMENASGHMTADDVLRETAKYRNKVSVATIYRILSWLTKYGLVCVTDLGGADLAYEYLGANRHHHLVCQQCGTQIEIPFDLVDPLVAHIRQHYDFESRIDHLAIFGTCRDCRAVRFVKD